MKIRIVLMVLLLGSMEGVLAAAWASVYHKKVSEEEAVEAAKKNILLFVKQNVPSFTQLLCSWNAIRPKKGHLMFYAQVRNVRTKKWGAWHHMVEWGHNVQRSYATSSDGFSKYIHVRLETELLHRADAFRIKVVGVKGASVKAVKGLAVTVVDMHDFKAEKITARTKMLASVYLKQVPKISQIALNHPDSNRICSPVSCTMLTQYLTGSVIKPELFAKGAYDKGLDAYGSWPFNMAHAFEYDKGKNWFYNTRLNSFAELHKQLARGLPVVVSVRGHLPGAPKPFPLGHLLVVTGWDNKTQEVLCHDPSIEEHQHVLRRYKLSDFLASWERSRRLTYWVEPVL